MHRRDFLHLIAMTILLPACGSSKVPPTAIPQPADCGFAYSSRALDAYYEKAKTEFENTHSHLSINLVSNTQFGFFGSTSSDIDVAEVDQRFMAILAKAGNLKALDSLFESQEDLKLDAFASGTIDACRWHGELFAIPAGIDPQMLYFNKDIFDTKHISYPTNDWTLDDFLEAALRIAEPDADPPLYGFVSENSFNSMDYIPFIYIGGGSLTDSFIDPKSAALSSDATVSAMQWYVDLALTHKVMPKPQDLRGVGGLQTAVVSRQAAMWFGALSARHGLSWDVPWKFNWGAVRQPKGKQQITLFNQRVLAINQNTQHLQAAWLWAKYLAEHPASDFDLPALTKELKSDKLLVAEPAELRKAVTKAMENAQAWPVLPGQFNYYRELDSALYSIFKGETTIRDAMVQVDKTLNDAIAQEQE